MIKSWKHKELRKLFETGKSTKINPQHKERLRELLFQLDSAVSPEDMNTPGNDFHLLRGNKKGYYSVAVRANWKLIFMFEGEDACLVNYLDYH
jgi:toxin HigB-1